MTKLISTIKVHGASERAVQQAFAAVQDAAAMAANTLRVEGQNDERLEETREQTQKVYVDHLCQARGGVPQGARGDAQG